MDLMRNLQSYKISCFKLTVFFKQMYFTHMFNNLWCDLKCAEDNRRFFLFLSCLLCSKFSSMLLQYDHFLPQELIYGD